MKKIILGVSVLELILVILKLVDILNISWWLILLPTWISFIILVITLISLYILIRNLFSDLEIDFREYL